METHAVVPEILDTVPPASATVRYAPGIEMKDGGELKPVDVTEAPTEVIWPAETNALYTVLFTDPDAPSRAHPLFREILHWLVVNVPGNTLKNGQTVVDYIGSGPPEGTGLHRYVLSVYKQPTRLPMYSFEYLHGRTGRIKFNTRDFVAKFNLGPPIAGNFFQAQSDDFIREKRSAQLKTACMAEKLVPDVLDTVPETPMGVVYASGGIVNFGSELTPTAVKDTPLAVIWPTEPGALYTLLFIDPDAPSRDDPQYRECLHWLVVNIPGNDIAAGETYAAYVGSGPPEGTGLHRYVFLVYKQSGGKFSELDHPKAGNRCMDGRPGFKTRDFAQKHGLVGPVAVNFYQAQYDDYCRVLQEEMGYKKEQ